MTEEHVTLLSLYASATTPAGRQAHTLLDKLVNPKRPRCRLCDHTVHARGLCRKHFQAAREAGEVGKTFLQRTDEWARWHDKGLNTRQAAEKMGMSHEALTVALTRAKKRGDERVLSRLGPIQRS